MTTRADQIDEFESMFKRARREPYLFEEAPLRSAALVTDDSRAEAESLRESLPNFLPRLRSVERWAYVVGDDYGNVAELLARVDAEQPDLIVTCRHLQEETPVPQHSLGAMLNNVKEIEMKLGIDSYSTRNSGLDPCGILNFAGDLGLRGVLFELTPFESFRDGPLQRIRETAEQQGLYVEFGMGSIFRRHEMAEKGISLLADAGYDVSGSDAQIVIDHLRIAEKLGSPILRCVAGNLFTRDEGHDMAVLAEDAVVILREACRAAEDMGLKIALENHADFTVRELMSLLARVNSPAFGFTLDCANLAFDLDEPLHLARMMAPHALTTHYKNYRIIRTAGGLALESCSVGDGDIDVAAIARLLAEHNPEINLNIEVHTQFAPFALNILEEEFFATHPSSPGAGLAWYLGKTWGREVRETLPENLSDGEESWAVEQEDIKRSVEWARRELQNVE